MFVVSHQEQLYTARLFNKFKLLTQLSKNTVSIATQEATSYYFTFNMNRQSYNRLAKTDEAQRLQKKRFLIKTSISHQLCSWPSFLFCSDEWTKKERTRLSVSVLYRPWLCSGQWNDLRWMAQAELVTFGDQWKDVALTDGKDTIYNQQAKLPLKKPSQEYKSQG